MWEGIWGHQSSFHYYEVFIYCEVTGVAIVSVRKELNELCQSTLDRSPRVLEQHRRNSEAEETLEFNPSMVFWQKTQPYTESKSDHWILVRKSRISFVLLWICKYVPNTAFVLEVLSIIYSLSVFRRRKKHEIFLPKRKQNNLILMWKDAHLKYLAERIIIENFWLTPIRNLLVRESNVCRTKMLMKGRTH